MNGARNKISGNVAAVRQVLVRCILLYRRSPARMDEAVTRIADSVGIERRRISNLYYDLITTEMTDEERHHAILGICAARVWLASRLRALADEYDADTALIEGAENQRYVRDIVPWECNPQNGKAA